jgi:hypothetical protein
MTTHILTQLPEAGALYNLIDLSAERAKRRPIDEATRLSNEVWAGLGTVQTQLSSATAEVRDIRSRQEQKPDFSGLSFDECADVLKALACFPQAEFGAYGLKCGPLFGVINPLWCQAMDQLSSLDAKRADRVIETAINAGSRRREALQTRGTNPAA